MMRALQNAQRRAVAALHDPEIHSDEPSQICMASKYTATSCRSFATAQNTQRRAFASLQQPKTHSDGLSQVCNSSKHTATSCRRFAWPRNTQRRAVADFATPKTHSDGLAQTGGDTLISHRWLRDDVPAPFYPELRLTFAAAKP